ncbi:MAG: threonine-phosphate decarboxylase CobD [Neorhizobium sp.]|nr:threonine-phosphate decarboxylase CobD [Neorhizobium sp.]
MAGSAFGGPIQHGGNLARARALFPLAPEPWIDLSTGINPHSYPYSPIPANAFSRLPEPDALAKLCALAASAYGAPAREMIVAAPGTQILLPIIAGLAKTAGAGKAGGGNRAIVLSPTYAEHARAAAMAGFEVSETDDLDRLAEGQLAIVVNPNNPTGRVVSRGDLLALAGLMRAKGGLLVVDEAFIDVSEAEGVADHVGEGGLVVLKSFGKFYGLAGVRLGFAMSSPQIISCVDERLGPWAVSGPALHIAGEALADGAWQVTMREQLRRDAARLDGFMEQASVRVAGGTSLFRFVRDGKAQALYQRLGEAGIMTRRFEERPDDLRIGLPSDDEWDRLAAALGG